MTQNAFSEPIAPFGAGEQHREVFPWLDYVQLLWFRRKLIIAITVFVAVAGYIHVNQIQSIYTATSTLIIGLGESQVIDIESVLTRDFYNEGIESELEVLRSRGLAAKIIEKGGLLNHPAFNPGLREPEEGLFDFLQYLHPRTWIPREWKRTLKEAMGQETEIDPPTEQEVTDRTMSTAINIFLGGLSLEQIEYSYVLRVHYSSSDRNLAARIANLIPEVYIVDQLEAKFEATEQANAWLTSQLADLETKVAESERAVEIFRDEHGMTQMAGRGILDAQLSELNSQLIVARAGKAEIDARLAQINRLLVDGSRGVETTTEVLSSQLIQQLRAQEIQIMSRASELAVEYGAKHPRMLQVNAELVEIRDRIDIEVDKVAASLENEAEFARARVKSLEESLREAQGLTSDQNKEAVQLRALQREAAANRALFETFLNRFKETSSTQGLETADARVISKAEVPGGPSYPNRQQKMTTIALLGFLGACTLVLGLQFLNPGLRSPEHVQQVLHEYVIGVIPFITGRLDLYDHVLKKPGSGEAEAINSMKFALALSNPDIEIKAVQVTSSVPEEGKTSLAIALARVVASSGKNVLLVDGDLRRSSINKKLGVAAGHKGLSDLVVAGDAPLSEFIQRDEKGQLDFMPVGTAQYANATDIFSSHRMSSIVDMLKSRYDLVVVDSPPVMAVADARIIGQVMDKTLFVVRWNKTPRKVAQAAVEQLLRSGTDLAGVVLQQVDLKRYGRFGQGDSGYYYHYGRYGRYYSE
jgi:capsular exopolysaccharide synthesis family protein